MIVLARSLSGLCVRRGEKHKELSRIVVACFTVTKIPRFFYLLVCMCVCMCVCVCVCLLCVLTLRVAAGLLERSCTKDAHYSLWGGALLLFFSIFLFPVSLITNSWLFKGRMSHALYRKATATFFFLCVCVCMLFGPREREKEEVSELYVVLMKHTFLCVCVCVFQLFYDTTYFRSRQTAKSVCEEARFLLVKSRMVKTTTKTLIEKRGQVLKQLPCY